MASVVKRQWMRCLFATLWATCVGSLHAADADGDSGLDGAFLAISSDIVHDHVALRSFHVSPRSLAAFIDICTLGKAIWINDQAISCLHAEAVENGSEVELEVPMDAITSPPVGYYLISTTPTHNATVHALKEPERSAMSQVAGSTAAGIYVAAAELGRAKAVDNKGHTLVFVAHGKNLEGNQPIHVFSVAAGRVTYAGTLPDWPERLMEIGGVMYAIVIPHGEGGLAIQVFSLWPQVSIKMFAGEGG